LIEFYTYDTSNGQRVAIMLEECGLAYRTHRVDLTKGEQRTADFLRLNPTGAIPVVVDADGPGGQSLTLSQSGAIMLYLAEKTGRFLPADPARRAAALQWLMHAVTDCASTTGVIYALSVRAPEKSPANVAFFEERLLRYFGVADARLADREWLADELSIADFALYPIYAVRKALADGAGMPHLARWAAGLAARPAVARAMGPVASRD
jgi:GSH-dependent disulfide-bond oxidoreductase